MVKTIFYLKTDKENNDGEFPIYCKIKYKNTVTTMSSGKWVTRKRWQATNHLRNPLKVKREMAVRTGLDRIKEDVDTAYRTLNQNIQDAVECYGPGEPKDFCICISEGYCILQASNK